MALMDPATLAALDLAGALRAPFPQPRWAFPLIREKAPCVVNYARGRHVFTRPDTFFVAPAKAGPSDCTWIVPGTEK
jgi:hypothetical protein